MDHQSSASNRTRNYNVVTAVIVALSLVACLVVVLIALDPSTWARARKLEAKPAHTDVESVAPTLQAPTPEAEELGAYQALPAATMTEMWAASAARARQTGQTDPTPTAHDAAEPAPSATTEPPTSAPTDAPLPTDVPTLTPTGLPPATAAVDSSQPAASPGAAVVDTGATGQYTLRGEVRYTSNTMSEAGCNWLGVAGEVFDAAGGPKTGVIVRVSGSGVDERATSGKAPEYGPSGWEVTLGEQPQEATYTVRLETGTGEALSEQVMVQTTGSCDRNLALLVFDEVQ